MEPKSIVINALELLIGKQNDFVSAFYFIDNCIKYGIKMINKRDLSLYWERIKCAYMDLADNVFKDGMTMNEWNEHKDDIIKMIENAKDLPDQLHHIRMMPILNKHRLIKCNLNEIYSDILMSFLKLKIVDNEDGDAMNEELVNGDTVAYDLLSYWYDSYYITRDLWNDYVLNENGEYVVAQNSKCKVITMFNVANWKQYELKTLLVFLILERFGNILLNEGNTYLNVKLSLNGDENAFVALKTKLQSSYGEDLMLEPIEGTEYNVVQIDLASLNKCIEPELSTSESDDDDDPID